MNIGRYRSSNLVVMQDGLYNSVPLRYIWEHEKTEATRACNSLLEIFISINYHTLGHSFASCIQALLVLRILRVGWVIRLVGRILGLVFGFVLGLVRRVILLGILGLVGAGLVFGVFSITFVLDISNEAGVVISLVVDNLGAAIRKVSAVGATDVALIIGDFLMSVVVVVFILHGPIEVVGHRGLLVYMTKQLINSLKRGDDKSKILT